MKRVLQLQEPVGAVTCPARLFDSVKKIRIDHNQENFLLVTLDVGKRVIGTHILFIGGRSALLIDPVTLFRRAILDNADSIILAHNHPSGCLSPSEEDIKFHEQLASGARLLQIEVLDIVIFNETEYYSFSDEARIHRSP